nr:hypothetical protein Itr_chr07CG04320 [Ipomoea trifida]
MKNIQSVVLQKRPVDICKSKLSFRDMCKQPTNRVIAARCDEGAKSRPTPLPRSPPLPKKLRRPTPFAPPYHRCSSNQKPTTRSKTERKKRWGSRTESATRRPPASPSAAPLSPLSIVESRRNHTQQIGADRTIQITGGRSPYACWNAVAQAPPPPLTSSERRLVENRNPLPEGRVTANFRK